MPTAPHSISSGHTTTRPFRASLLATLGIAFVTMLVALDQTVVGTALPTIVAELQGFHLYAWIATAYLLTSVVTVPIFGRLGDDFGRKPFVMASIVTFTGASLLCGLATSMPMLIGARALQGVGGGMLVGTAFASIPDLFPVPHTRLRWQAIMSAAFGIANAVGPTLGGVLTQSYGWRSVFFVNLPVGVVSLFFVWRFLPWIRHREHAGPVRLDWIGVVLLALTLGGLQLSVEQVPKAGLTLSSWVLMGVTACAGAALWTWENKVPNPILPLRMFRDPKLSALFLLALMAGFSMFSLLFYAPLLFQGGFGMSPRTAGVIVTPLVVFVTVGSIANGRLVTRIPSPNVMLTIGFVLLTVCCLGAALAGPSMPHAVMAVSMALGGLGLGLVLPNLTTFCQEQAGRQQFGTVTAMLQSLRMIGGMMGAALTGALVAHLYTRAVHVGLAQVGALPWFARVADPQILVNRQDQTALLAELARHGHNGGVILDLARTALRHAIHIGIGAATIVSAWAIWQTRRVSAIRFAARSTVVTTAVPESTATAAKSTTTATRSVSAASTVPAAGRSLGVKDAE